MSKTFEVAGITPGEWFASLTSRPRGTIYIDAQLRDGVIQEIAACGPTETQGQQEKNAALFVEAGTVANETGLTPRQLAEQRAELLAVLQKIMQQIKKSDYLLFKDSSEFYAAHAAIKKATGK